MRKKIALFGTGLLTILNTYNSKAQSIPTDSNSVPNAVEFKNLKFTKQPEVLYVNKDLFAVIRDEDGNKNQYDIYARASDLAAIVDNESGIKLVTDKRNIEEGAITRYSIWVADKHFANFKEGHKTYSTNNIREVFATNVTSGDTAFIPYKVFSEFVSDSTQIFLMEAEAKIFPNSPNTQTITSSYRAAIFDWDNFDLTTYNNSIDSIVGEDNNFDRTTGEIKSKEVEKKDEWTILEEVTDSIPSKNEPIDSLENTPEETSSPKSSRRNINLTYSPFIGVGASTIAGDGNIYKVNPMISLGTVINFGDAFNLTPDAFGLKIEGSYQQTASQNTTYNWSSNGTLATVAGELQVDWVSLASRKENKVSIYTGFGGGAGFVNNSFAYTNSNPSNLQTVVPFAVASGRVQFEAGNFTMYIQGTEIIDFSDQTDGKVAGSAVGDFIPQATIGIVKKFGE